MSVETPHPGLDRLRNLFTLDREAVAGRLSPWFYGYHSDLYRHGVPFDVYIAKVEAIRRELAGARRILDFGAGFGVYACLLRILGVPEVVALDYHREKARVAARLVEYLGLDGVTVLQGDGTVLPFPPSTFDGATALACLSHIRDARRALEEIAAALRPDGRVYVFEDNNSLYPGYYRGMEPEWSRAENGAPSGEQAPDGPVREGYVSVRRRLIRERFADLDPEALETCARETRGLYGDLIIRAVEEFRSGGRIRNPRRHLVCNPVNGEFDEYPLHPYLIRRLMKETGFTPRLRGPFTGPFRGRFRALKRATAGIMSFFPAVVPWVSPTFVVVGRRSAGART